MGPSRRIALALFVFPVLASPSFVELKSGKYATEVSGVKIRLEKGSVVHGPVRLRFGGRGRGAKPQPVGSQSIPVTEYEYAKSGTPKETTRAVRVCDRVRYKSLWPGVDVEFYLHGGRLQFEFVLAPGARVENIVISFDGADRIDVMPDGGIRVMARGEEAFSNLPVSWLQQKHARSQISARYVTAGRRTVGLAIQGSSAWKNTGQSLSSSVL